MSTPLMLDTGDRVAWSGRDQGVVVAHAPPHGPQHRLTVDVWRDGQRLGHVARIPAALLSPVPSLHAARARGPRQGAPR